MDVPDRPLSMTVSPETAQDWLENRNLSERRPTNNRTISQHTVRKYATAMAEGRWKLVHQGIAFDRDGWLIDGQHRLSAIVAAGIPVPMMVIPNCDPDTFDVLDTGLRRQAAHLIPVHGRDTAAAARILGTVTAAWSLQNVQSGVYDNSATNDQILAVVEEWGKELTEWITPVRNCYAQIRLNKGVHLAVLAQAARTRHADKLEDWVTRLTTGENLSQADPRLHLRNRTMRDYSLLNSSSGRGDVYRLTVRSWNAYVRGTPVHKLGVYNSGPVPELAA